MTLIKNKNMNLAKYLFIGIFLAFGLFIRVTPAFAEDNSANAVDASNTSDQNAAAGPADSGTPPADSPAAQTSDTPPSTDSTGPPASSEPAVTTDATTTTDPVAPASTEQPASTPAPELPPACNAQAAADAQTPADPSASSNSPSGNGSSLDTTQNTTANNNLCSSANSGNASVADNNTGGNATTGNAQDIATILNLLNSSTGLSGSDLATFVQNIYGDVTGDIYIDPGVLSQLQSILCGCNANVNSSTNSTINNDIYLGANSGNADVSNNGTGGNATTGNATALLNLVNIINSIIASGQTFIGTINIYGNLNGDILLPPDLISLLNATGAPPAGQSTGPPHGHGHHDTTMNDTQTINNNIDLGATSGNATVSDNGVGGNATTGNAATNLTILNLTGRQVVAKDALLVFVNVLGHWVGLILNAPAGATSAALGSGVDVSGICNTCQGNGSLNSTTNSTINNNIVLASQSGNATVSNNGVGGNATTGNATSSLNLVNIINSNFSLSGWFGILFINVFGTWNGSFGINTAAGDPPVIPVIPPAGSGTTTTTGASAPKVFKYVPKAAAGGSSAASSDDSNDDQETLGIGGSFDQGNVGGSLAGESTFNPWVALGCGSACFMLLSLFGKKKKDQPEAIEAVGEILYPSI